MTFAVRRKIIEGIQADPWWSKEYEAARTTEQIMEVVEAYCREKGYKVKQVELDGKKDEGK